MAFLRLSYHEVELITVALNNARITIFTEEQKAQLPAFLRTLRRYYVASWEERKEDIEERGRKPGRKPSSMASPPPGPTVLPFEDDETVKCPPRGRSG